MKKESLEEYIERNTKGIIEPGVRSLAQMYIRYGAKWQAENMRIHLFTENTSVRIEDDVIIVEKNDKSIISYSEEEVYDILFKHTEYFSGFGVRLSLTDWFELQKK